MMVGRQFCFTLVVSKFMNSRLHVKRMLINEITFFQFIINSIG